MAIEAGEIENKDFAVSVFRGYKISEVDDYLDELAAEVERLQTENRALQTEAQGLREHEKRVSEMEQTLRDTLITAQRAAEDVVKASREKAAAMVHDSELEGRRIVEEAEQQAAAAAQRREAINRDVAGVKALFRRIIGEQLRILDESYPDIESQPSAPWQPAAAAGPVLADFDRTQEFSMREVREQAMEEERAEFPGLREY